MLCLPHCLTLAIADCSRSGTGEFSLSSSGEFDDPDEAASLQSESISTLLSASNELRELAHLSLGLLVSQLEARLAGAGAAGTGNGVVPPLRCAMYSRSPNSLSSGKLQLQLVAATDAREAEAAQARQDLFLGVPGASGTYQEAWIVEQPLIMLPDSGGLVVPLCHNSFLVGLLVVERGRPEGDAAPLQPPAAALFSAGDLGVIRRSGRALSLACAMDLRASLERAGHAVRQRQVQGLVLEARKPLSTLRTLGAMLRPRLEEGEPERDMTDGIVAQGARLGELVNQLQAALAPPPAAQTTQPAAFAARWDPAGRDAGWTEAQPAAASTQQQQQQRSGGGAGGNGALPLRPAYPALPSSSIGGDYGGAPPTSAPYTAVAAEPAAAPAAQPTPERQPVAPAAASHDQAFAAAADLSAVLAPLLATAANFASVSGVAFKLAVGPMPDALVAIEALPLKRMLAMLLDGVVDSAARGDSIEVEARLQPWGGAGGVAVAVALLRGAGAEASQASPEFEMLEASARQAGGWFSCEECSLGEVTAVLWLPTATAPS